MEEEGCESPKPPSLSRRKSQISSQANDATMAIDFLANLVPPLRESTMAKIRSVLPEHSVSISVLAALKVKGVRDLLQLEGVQGQVDAGRICAAIGTDLMETFAPPPLGPHGADPRCRRGALRGVVTPLDDGRTHLRALDSPAEAERAVVQIGKLDRLEASEAAAAAHRAPRTLEGEGVRRTTTRGLRRVGTRQRMPRRDDCAEPPAMNVPLRRKHSKAVTQPCGGRRPPRCPARQCQRQSATPRGAISKRA